MWPLPRSYRGYEARPCARPGRSSSLIPAPLLVGLWLVYWSEAGHGKEQLHPIIADSLALKIAEHLGAGLIVAALVASLFHLREFSEMFRDLGGACVQSRRMSRSAPSSRAKVIPVLRRSCCRRDRNPNRLRHRATRQRLMPIAPEVRRYMEHRRDPGDRTGQLSGPLPDQV